MALSIAEKYRQHKREFDLAQDLGCTPLEAKHELRRREARARVAELQRKLEATRIGLRHRRERNDPRGKPWMMQD